MILLSKLYSAALDQGYRVLKVLCLGQKDVREADECAPYGVDSNPIAGMDAVYMDTGTREDPVIVGYLNKGQLAQPGEMRIYSTDSDGALKSYLWLHGDGTMEVGGKDNHLAQYEGLQTAFDQLKTDFNNLVMLFNTHVHGGGTISGSTGAPAAAGTSSSADITGAKLANIKTQ